MELLLGPENEIGLEGRLMLAHGTGGGEKLGLTMLYGWDKFSYN